VRCVEPPELPYLPANGPRPFTVGGSNDYAAEVAGTMSGAEGSYDSVTGVTSETGPEGGVGAGVANTYSLQLNTRPFTTSVCNPSPNAGCRGWQQFLYSSSGGSVFIQYWLLRYNTTCPGGWNSFSFPGSTDIYCWRNGPNAAAVARQPITNLANLRLAGGANAAGNDSVTMFVGTTTAVAANAGSILDLGTNWKGAEFILVGDCCSSEATFNAGSTLVVRTTVHNGTTGAPTCHLEGFTGETNNLNLVGTTAVSPGASPAIISRQSNSPGTAASCQAAEGIGDTHLRTFSGFFYDFQAAGDFVLAETGPDFVVQARQVSGAPTWPNASVNSAVGARMGKTQVSICLPNRVEVDGERTKIEEDNPMVLPGGVDISRTGSVYLVRGPDGDSVRAQVYDGWIDVSVGLGRWPSPVRGLLASAGDKINQLATRDGEVLSQPISFEDLYQRYGDSWRVPDGESFLCGKEVKPENPDKPFTVEDLDPERADRARAICTEAGVRKKGTLLDACILDVVVIGDSAAAEVFAGAPTPAAVGPSP
jgi:hypothetical protein